MNLSIMLAALWAITANLLAMIPSRDNHWARAYWLIASGIPILGYVTWQNGPWIGLIVLGCGVSILRWPANYFLRWIMSKTIRRDRA